MVVAGREGFEPSLFGFKVRYVANYTTGQRNNSTRGWITTFAASLTGTRTTTDYIRHRFHTDLL